MKLAIAFLAILPCSGSVIGILADQGIDYPPTSSTGYPLFSLSDAVYSLPGGSTLNQVSIDGKLYLEVEGPDVPVVALPVIEPPVVPPVRIPVETPEPATWIVMVAVTMFAAWEKWSAGGKHGE